MTQKEKEILAERFVENSASSRAYSDIISEYGEYDSYGITYDSVSFYDSYMIEDGLLVELFQISDFVKEYYIQNMDDEVVEVKNRLMDMIKDDKGELNE